MAPLVATSSECDKIDPRKAALEEAASVLRAVSTGGAASDSSDDAADDDDHDDGASPAKGGGSGASETADAERASGADPSSASTDEGGIVNGGGGPGGVPSGGGPKAAAVPKSRSDVLAAARRRAEERKSRAASNRGGDRKPPPPSPSALAAADNAAAVGVSDNATTSSSSSSSMPHAAPPPPSRTDATVASRQRRQTAAASINNQMDWFNLLGVVTNPASGSGHYYDGQGGHSVGGATSPGSVHGGHHPYHHRSRHGYGLSSHGTPISLDHVGSDGTRGASASSDADGASATVAGSLLTAAGLSDWATYADSSSASANATLTSVASGLDEFTGWFDHYSRKYLGTVAGIDGVLGGLEDGDVVAEYDGASTSAVVMGAVTGAMGRSMMHHHHPRPSMLAEYEPEFGPDDAPSSQLEELPRELAELDLASVEGFLSGGAGMLGMRFEDRGGGFDAMRERRRVETKAAGGGWGGGDVDQEEEEKRNEVITASASADGRVAAPHPTDGTTSMASVDDTVPEIFFSPYFDLTDPACFEDLLVIGDEEVARMRAREAELHALADRKVREAEEVARRDAENENVVPRPPPRRVQEGERGGDDATTTASSPGSMDETATAAGTSLTRDAKTTPTPADSNVITLRKPETFTSHLDAIELVLLDQVRSKSEKFFRETNRFSELQRLVTGSVDEVRELRTELHSMRERCVTNVEIVPAMDDTRGDLRAISRVLESVEDVANCKASIASLMGAGDHLGAVEAIRSARRVLAGSPDSEGEDDQDGDGERTSMSSYPSHRHSTQQFHQPLGKLKALSKVSEQLNEYEKLVVQNLTDELVETFLSWGTEGSNIDHSAPPRVSLTTDRRAKIRSVVQSLRVCGKLGGAGVAYRRKLCELISVTVKAIVTECVADAAKNATGGGADSGRPAAKGTMAGVAGMTLDQFFDCISMLFEQILGLLWGAFAVNKFCIDEGFILDDGVQNNGGGVPADGVERASSSSAGGSGERSSQHTPSATAAALAAAADLSEKSVSELLRLRREAHSLVSFDGMRRLWDTSLTFTHRLERFSGRKAYGLRSTLLAQAKSFVERKHESNMSALVAALDSERWVQCNVSAERQAALTRLCSGRAAFSSRKTTTWMDTTNNGPSSTGSDRREKMTDAEVEGLRYKVVWSCLLLLEMVMDDVACAAHFQTLATNVVGKVAELLRLFNTRSTHLVLGAGAIHSAARLKSINAKHLAIVTQCIALMLVILPHIRAALMAQLPAKQHTLLYELDKIKSDYHEHSEKILSKLVSIIGGIVEHSLAPRIANTDFDSRAKGTATEPASGDASIVECCQFLDNVVTNTKKMHQVLFVMLPAELLRDVFSRIFAYLDHKVPSLFKAAAAVTSDKKKFSMPSTEEGKLQMIKEVEYMANTLNGLSGVQPWNFTATKILEQELDISRDIPFVEQLMEEEERTEESEAEPAVEKEIYDNNNDQADDGSNMSAEPTMEQNNLDNEKESIEGGKSMLSESEAEPAVEKEMDDDNIEQAGDGSNMSAEPAMEDNNLGKEKESIEGGETDADSEQNATKMNENSPDHGNDVISNEANTTDCQITKGKVQ